MYNRETLPVNHLAHAHAYTGRLIELRHLWQAARLTDRKKSALLPMAHGSRGKYSEVDTEAFAIQTLREWRRGVVTDLYCFGVD